MGTPLFTGKVAAPESVRLGASDSWSSAQSASELKPLLKGLQKTASKAQLSALRSLAEESDRGIFFSDLLSLGRQALRRQDWAGGAFIFHHLAQVSPRVPKTIQEKARAELTAMQGGGPWVGRVEYLGQRLLQEATDYRVILPMMASSVVFQGLRTASMARFANPLKLSWYDHGLGLRFLSGSVGFTGEVAVFSGMSRGLRMASGEPVGPWYQELGSAALTLGLLKSMGFFGNRLFYWTHGINEIGHATRLAPWLNASRFLYPQATMYLGLLAAHGAEVKLGWRPSVSGEQLLVDTLGSLISLGIGARLGQQVLGPRFQQMQTRLGLMGEIYGQYADRPSRPKNSIDLNIFNGPQWAVEGLPNTFAMSALPAEVSGDNASPLESRMFSEIQYGGMESRRSQYYEPFLEALNLLYAHYSGRAQANPEILSRWPQLKERLENKEVTPADVDIIWTMFQEAARDDAQNHQPWFFEVSRWFGTADHDLSGRNGWAKDSPRHFGVDPIKLGVLVYSQGLNPEPHSLGEGLRRYLVLPPELRTHFTDQLIVLDQALESIRQLNSEGLTRERLRHFRSPVLHDYLERTFIDLKDLLLEHNSHPALIYHAIMNTLHGRNEEVNLYRVHINMTTINERDGTNFHGNVYLDTVKAWFQEKLGRTYVVQNPERTTFEFLAPSTRQVREIMADFQMEVKTRVSTTLGVDPAIIAQFMPRAVISGRRIHRGNLYSYAIQERADLEIFRPVLEFGRRLNVDQLKKMDFKTLRKTLQSKKPDFRGIHRSQDSQLRKTLDALILKASLQLNRELAAQTTFFEKEQTDIKRWQNGRPKLFFDNDSVYEESDLPRRGPLKDKWEEYRLQLPGFVGPGQYDPAFHNGELRAWGGHPQFNEGRALIDEFRHTEINGVAPEVNHLLRALPRLGHIKGFLSHGRKGSAGGLMQQFHKGMFDLADAQGSEVQGALAHLQAVADQLWEGFYNVYSLGVTDPRNAWTPKQHREFLVHRGNDRLPVRSNFFVQEVALAQNSHLAVLEYDSLRAFNDHYGLGDVVDSQYNQVRDAIYLAAIQMKMPLPLVNPTGGDHLSISFSGRDLGGNPIDPGKYCLLVQDIVRKKFSGQTFHDLHKVSVRELKVEGVERETLENKGLLQKMQQEMNLSTPPLVVEGLSGETILKVPTHNREGEHLSSGQWVSYLESQGIPLRSRAETVQIYRLPIWQKARGRKGDSDYFIFSRFAPKGYRPFSRSLSVSLVLDTTPVLKDAQDLEVFQRTEDRLGVELGRVKGASWPAKEGFRDFRQ